MADFRDHLRAAEDAARAAAFEADFARRCSPGALAITLSEARDRFLRGLNEIETVIAMNIAGHTNPGDTE